MSNSRAIVVFSGVVTPTRNEAWGKRERRDFRKNLAGRITCNYDIYIYKGYTSDLACFLKDLRCRYTDVEFADLSYSSQNSALLSNALTPGMYNNFHTNATSNLLGTFISIVYLAGIRNSTIYDSEPQDEMRTLAVNEPNDLFSSDVVFHARYPTGPNSFKSFTTAEITAPNGTGVFVHTQGQEQLLVTRRSSAAAALSITSVNLFELASYVAARGYKAVGRPLLLNPDDAVPTVYQLLNIDQCDNETSISFYLHQQNLVDFMWASGFYPTADGDFVFSRAKTAALLLNRHFKNAA